MVKEYQKLVKIVKNKLIVIDFIQTDDSDYVATFENNNGAKIQFIGDKYAIPSYGIWLYLGEGKIKSSMFYGY